MHISNKYIIEHVDLKSSFDSSVDVFNLFLGNFRLPKFNPIRIKLSISCSTFRKRYSAEGSTFSVTLKQFTSICLKWTKVILLLPFDRRLLWRVPRRLLCRILWSRGCRKQMDRVGNCSPGGYHRLNFPIQSPQESFAPFRSRNGL